MHTVNDRALKNSTQNNRNISHEIEIGRITNFTIDTHINTNINKTRR